MIVLDVHVVPPNLSESGRPRDADGKCLVVSLRRLEGELNRLGLTMRKIHKTLERNTNVVIDKINCWCASVISDPANESLIQEIAA